MNAPSAVFEGNDHIPLLLLKAVGRDRRKVRDITFRRDASLKSTAK